MAECQLPKLNVAGSNPVSRSTPPLERRSVLPVSEIAAGILPGWERHRQGSSRSGRCPTPTSSSTCGLAPTPAELVRLVASLREPRTTIGGVNLVAGFRPELWAVGRARPEPGRAQGLQRAAGRPGGYTLPATQHDIVVWLAGAAYDVVFDLSHGVGSALGSHATFANEIVGWPYHRDLRPDRLHRWHREPNAGRGGHGRRGRTRGARRLRQRPAPPAVGARPRTVGSIVGGRAGAGDRSDEARQHRARPASRRHHTWPGPTRTRFGKIFRRNIGYGTATRHGTIFVGFSRDRARLDAMLASMIGLDDGSHDRLTEFTPRSPVRITSFRLPRTSPGSP